MDSDTVLTGQEKLGALSKKCRTKIFMFSCLYIRYKFRSSMATDK